MEGPVGETGPVFFHQSGARRAIAAIGAWIIDRLICPFGRTHRRDAIAWLIGPLGGTTIGDATYDEVAPASCG
ncbi:MAG: hypothetical protein ABJE66_01610 [Deltaproteobacteria bacterium]